MSGRQQPTLDSSEPHPGAPSESDSFALRCRGVVKRYTDVVAVDGLDLEMRRGECLGLLGPNGAGKTTTVEVLEGLTEPDEGSVEVLGQQWGRGDDRALRARLGVQLQETELTERLTVAETVRLFRSFYPSGRSVGAVLDLLGLSGKRDAWVSRLSGGQKQRLALACALVCDPELLFLDEPTTGLDPQARLRIWEVIETFRERGGTVLLTTHYMEEAAKLCDRVVIIDRGKVIAAGSPAQLIEGLGARQIVELKATPQPAIELLGGLPGVVTATEQDGRSVLAVDHIPTALPAVLALLEEQGAVLQALATHEPTLEDVFVHETGRGLRDE